MGDPKRKHGGWKGPHPRPNSLQTNKHGPSRQPSYDSIQGRVQREGITARNLIKYNVPLENGYPSDRSTTSTGRVRTPSSSYPASGVKKSPSTASSPRKAVSSIGIGQMRQPRRPRDDRARYWGHMLDTLKRTIDEIYTACEEDESEVECREMILILEHSVKDFYSLIEKMKKFREYENADEGQRPTSLAWDERKTSPGKPMMQRVILERTLSAAAKAAASLSPSAPVSVSSSISEHVTTWADRVRGAAVRPKPKPTAEESHKPLSATASKEGGEEKETETPVQLVVEVEKEKEKEKEVDVLATNPEEDDDGGGWEKVEKRPRGGSKNKMLRRSTSNSSSNSQHPIKANSHPSYWKNNGSNGSSNSSTGSAQYMRLRSESCSSNGSNLRRGLSMSETNISVRSDGGSVQSRGHANNTAAPLQNIQIPPSTDANCTTVQSESSTLNNSREICKEKETSGEQAAYSRVVKYGRTAQEDETRSVELADEVKEQTHESPDQGIEAEETGNSKDEEFERREATIIETKVGDEKNEEHEAKNGRDASKNLEVMREEVEEEMEEVKVKGEQEQDKVEEDEEDDEDEEEEEYESASSPNTSRKRKKFIADAYDAEAEDGGESENATTPYTSVDFTSGEEDEDRRTLLQIDKELADAEDEETALTTQLMSEEQNYRLQVDAVASAIASADFEIPMTWEEIVEEQKKTGGMSWDLIASLDPDCHLESENTPDSTLCGSIPPLTVSVGDKFRTPGRGVQMHERLSSPSRKRSAEASSLRSLQEKQDKAKLLRNQVIGARTEKIRELMHKVEEAKALKNDLLNERKQLQAQRMLRADMKRKAQLERKIRKAHDEETKGREIAFIQSLEQEQKQHNIFAKHQESELRLQEMQEERKRKQEEKAEREAAAEERRRVMEKNRLARMMELQQRRESRDRKIASKNSAREKTRLENARAKELERESKRAAIIANEKNYIEELKVKIYKKQEDTERRHQEQLREISRKAFEMSVKKHSTEDADDAPPLEPYASNKWCTVCHTMINSEVILQSHLRGKKHLSNLRERMETNWEKSQIERFNLEHIVDAPKDEPDPKEQADKERKKNMKKRIKKLKQRMSTRGTEFVKEMGKSGSLRATETAHKSKLVKFVKEVNRYLAIGDNGPWVQRRVSALDKSMGEALRCLEVKTYELAPRERAPALAKLQQNQDLLIDLNGDVTLCNVLSLIDHAKADQTPLLPERSFQLTCQVYQGVCTNNWNSSFIALFSNRTSLLVEALSFRLGLFITDGFGRDSGTHQLIEASNLPSDVIAVSLMETLEAILSSIATRYPQAEKMSDTASTGGESIEGKSGPSAIPSAEQISARIQDLVSYLVCLGILDRLTTYLSNVRGPLDSNCKAAAFVRVSLKFLESILKLMAFKYSLEGRKGKGGKQSNDDPTQLLSTVLATDLFGLASLLYGMLLHSAAPSKRDTSPPPLAEVTQAVTMAGLRLINAMSELSLTTTQIVLGEEGTVLQLRHIFSYLLWYCGHMSSGRTSASALTDVSWRLLLHEVVLCVGHFTVRHTDNQNCLQSGQSPTVLQLLCQLPFEYFSDRRRTQVLYPTLIAACFENDANSEIVKSELSLSLLSNFLEEHISKDGESGSSEVELRTYKDKRMDLRTRFPRDLWSSAFNYFTS